MTPLWTLSCSACDASAFADGTPTVCTACGAPWLIRYPAAPAAATRADLAGRPWTMWRYREWLPIRDDEAPVTLGEGGTPLIAARVVGEELGMTRLFVKDESQNPTGSFKARGLSAAVTRAVRAGVERFTVPTAGNAGVALSAYASRVGLAATVFTPAGTPPRILEQMQTYGAEVRLIDGHIGDCGRASREYAARTGAFDVSTLREPYRIEGKKTLGLEVAEQLGWELPDAVVYPTGGGTGLIGMWVAFRALLKAGWVEGARAPRLYSVQSSGCAPVVKAVLSGADRTERWEDPQTIAWGLRVPAPLGGALMLRAIAETGGGAVAVPDEAMVDDQRLLAHVEGIDASPEGGATLAGLRVLLQQGAVSPTDRVVLFNTGAGWLYRS
ncbi:MAG TPA: threonine synthase [Gemmatimonadales bacterium]